MLRLEKALSIEELKLFLGKLKGDIKTLKKTGKRTIRVYELLDIESVSEYSAAQHKNFEYKLKEELERAYKFLMDEKEADKAGFNYIGGKKNILLENKKKQLEWADKAYPNIDYELWDAEMDVETIVSFIKNISMEDIGMRNVVKTSRPPLDGVSQLVQNSVGPSEPPLVKEMLEELKFKKWLTEEKEKGLVDLKITFNLSYKDIEEGTDRKVNFEELNAMNSAIKEKKYEEIIEL